jgi:hypothetical protein
VNWANLTKLAESAGLNRDDVWAVSEGGGTLLAHELEVDPHQFLAQAEVDLATGGDAGGLNAVTNAKRAIVSQMDQILLTFGYASTRWKMPRKIETLKSLGVVVPRILRKVSSARNFLEHEYRLPTQEQIEEAVDLATLFVAAARHPMEPFADEFELGNYAADHDSNFACGLSFWCPANIPTYHVAAFRRSDNGTRHSLGRIELTCAHEPFPFVVRLAFATNSRYGIEDAVDAFCQGLWPQ